MSKDKWMQDAPSPEQLSEFFKLVSNGAITYNVMLRLLYENEYSQSYTEDEKIAVGILGQDKVVGYHAVLRSRNVTKSSDLPDYILFSVDTLQECAEENRNGADWRLIYVIGFSLARQVEIEGTNPHREPNFKWDTISDWYKPVQCRKKNENPDWANEYVMAGYRLLDFSGHRGKLREVTWKKGQDQIAILGESYERAESPAVTEACFSLYLVNGRKESLLRGLIHQGDYLGQDKKMSTYCDEFIGVGLCGLDRFNFKVRAWNDWGDLKNHIVVLSRKPDLTDESLSMSITNTPNFKQKIASYGTKITASFDIK